jgi:hypothetical protein
MKLSIGMCRVKRTQSIGCGLVLALAGLSCAWPSKLLADEAPATQPVQHADSDVSMKKWLADLASPEASIRDAARAKLMTLGRDQLPELQKLVGQNLPLAPSQATALRQIVQEVYLAGESYESNGRDGFLGILMDQSLLAIQDFDHGDESHIEPGVVVAERIPGFCASRMLLDGDVILGTTNPAQVFRTTKQLQLAVQAMMPGETIHLQVLRNGRVIDVPLVLDSSPPEVTKENITEFKLRRAAKFNDYWQKSFAPLLKEEVG